MLTTKNAPTKVISRWQRMMVFAVVGLLFVSAASVNPRSGDVYASTTDDINQPVPNAQPHIALDECATDSEDETSSTYVFRETMNSFPTGPKDDDEWKELWPGTKWANGPDEGRVVVDNQVAYGGSGKSTRILYPKGGQQSKNSGAQWFINLNGEYEDLYMSYWVRFDEDFDFVLGGKLPGFGGAVSFDDRTHQWSGRLMWREDGKVEFYVHVPKENNFDPGDRFWWNTEGFQATLVPGRWHHIEIRMRLNTPGQYDGLMEGWFDGVKAAHYPNFYFRDEPTQSTKIAWVFFSTFFGGSSSPIWQAKKDEHAWFDEFIVSHSRIGYPGPAAACGQNT